MFRIPLTFDGDRGGDPFDLGEINCSQVHVGSLRDFPLAGAAWWFRGSEQSSDATGRTDAVAHAARLGVINL